jgi:hypothetical protein
MFDIKVNNSSVKCDLFNTEIHKTPYMFRPAVPIIRGCPTLWGNTLHVSYRLHLTELLFTLMQYAFQNYA